MPTTVAAMQQTGSAAQARHGYHPHTNNNQQSNLSTGAAAMDCNEAKQWGMQPAGSASMPTTVGSCMEDCDDDMEDGEHLGDSDDFLSDDDDDMEDGEYLGDSDDFLSDDDDDDDDDYVQGEGDED